jgi:rhodanese-related sulfurtransferase
MNLENISEMLSRKNGWMLAAIVLLFSGCERPAAETERVPPEAAPPAMEAAVENIEPGAAATLLKENANTVVLDIRTPEEFREGHIEGSININFKGDDFDAGIAKLDKSVPYVIHCASGGRSGQSLPKFESLGFKKIYHLDAGFLGWSAEGLPVSP